ncbi:calcium/sodium antiporter [Aeoliella mucimassa]|uniref:Inner membrane protein YrbG n=1 Tax=Aeoliella mucimassa TaxID=2527972 RepID=A0A518ARB7_9BACT|nr:calcium/sodium antiporter [Aeoliella mucimassa]QDU57260.1 Inner membrane protein YrbG [Aeoliella mucimassa]
MNMVGLLIGFGLLIAGAELLVRGASRLAARAGVSPLVVGLTVVAFGTSAPELAVSIKASLAGQVDVALGNVIGSNTFNVLFILGLSAMIVPLTVSSQLIRLDVPVMIAASLLVAAVAWGGTIGPLEGAVLLAAMLGYTYLLFRIARRENSAQQATENSAPATNMVWSLVLVAVGMAMLVLGAKLLVDNAVAIATQLGVSQLVIGLTIVAVGTSLPEVVTSIVASVRGERDIAVGNVVGSNIFNLLAVLGVAACVSPAGLPVSEAVQRFDLPVMVAVSVACLPIFFTGMVIARWEGTLLFGYYLAYTAYLLLTASGSSAQHTLRDAMVGFVIPITAVTLAVLTFSAWRQRRA